MEKRRLVNATTLEVDHGIPKSTCYRLARLGLVPSYRIGPRRGGVRFVVEEMLEPLRQPAGSGGKPLAERNERRWT